MNQPEPQYDKFEERLAEAMRHVDAPAGFADRVLARSRVQPPAQARVIAMPPRYSWWAGGVIAAALLGGVFLGEQQHIRRQREQAALAQQQFEEAMRITDRTLEHTREQLQHAGIQIGN